MTPAQIIKIRYPFYDEDVVMKDMEFNGEQVQRLMIDYAEMEVKKISLNLPVIGWVACSERMPDYDGNYLCYVRHPQECGNVWTYQIVINCVMNIWDTKNGEQVTHWQELPKPPCQ